MRKLIVVASIAIAPLLQGPVAAQTAGAIVGTAPGVAGAAQTIRTTATITAIDPATRAVTLKGENGREVGVTAGPEVANFAQMKVGDQVSVTYVEALMLELRKGGGMPVVRRDEVGGDLGFVKLHMQTPSRRPRFFSLPP